MTHLTSLIERLLSTVISTPMVSPTKQTFSWLRGVGTGKHNEHSHLACAPAQIFRGITASVTFERWRSVSKRLNNSKWFGASGKATRPFVLYEISGYLVSNLRPGILFRRERAWKLFGQFKFKRPCVYTIVQVTLLEFCKQVAEFEKNATFASFDLIVRTNL
jgi:hypothetical protein